MRKQAIFLKKKGLKLNAIAELLGVHRKTVTRWWSYQSGSTAGSQKRGAPTGTGRVFSDWQEQEIQRLICNKTPNQLKLAFALWDRQAVQELIRDRYQVMPAIRTDGDYLARWGLTAQRPVKRAYERQPAAVKSWLDKKSPAIEQRAKAENAEIHWGDGTGVRNNADWGKSYAPKGTRLLSTHLT